MGHCCLARASWPEIDLREKPGMGMVSMKKGYSVSLLMLVWVASACSFAGPPATSGGETPSPAAPDIYASPTLAVKSPTPSVSLTPVQPEATRGIAVSLPAPVCVLDPEKMAVIRLDPEGVTSATVSPPGLAVTGYDTRVEDATFVYSTAGGQLLFHEGDEVRSILQIPPPSEVEFSIKSFKLSPDGTKVAVSITIDGWQTDNDSAPIVQQNSGLFIIDLENGHKSKLVSHIYPNAEAGEDVVDVSIYIDPLWSPDGKAIFTKTVNWEWLSVAWIYPIDGPRVEIHRPADILAWSEGSWSSDSRFLMLSGRTYADVSTLDRVDRSTETVQTLLDGIEEQTYILNSHVDEDRVLFTASTSDRAEFHLYEGRIAGDAFTYQVAGYGEAICSPFRLVWDSKGEYGILSCGDSIRAISSDGTLNTEFSGLIPDINLAQLRQFGWCD